MCLFGKYSFVPETRVVKAKLRAEPALLVGPSRPILSMCLVRKLGRPNVESYPRRARRPAPWAWLLLGLCLALPARAESPQVHLHVFLSSTCPHCQSVERPALERLASQLGCTIVPHYHDVDSMDEYKRLVALERRLGDTGNDLPAVVAGDRILGGNKEIEAGLAGLLKQHAAAGLPDITVPTVAEADAMLRGGGAAGPARLAYFEQPGCRECARVDRMLGLAAERCPGLEVRRFAMTSREDRVLLEALCARAGVPEVRRLLVPAVFAGKRALVQEEITDEALDALLASTDAAGTPGRRAPPSAPPPRGASTSARATSAWLP